MAYVHLIQVTEPALQLRGGVPAFRAGPSQWTVGNHDATPVWTIIIMSKNTVRVTAPRGIAAPSNPSDAPLVPFRWIQDFMPHVGEVRLRDVMRAPEAPRPVLGGGKRSRALWSRDAVVQFFNDIAKSGVWPEAEKEAA